MTITGRMELDQVTGGHAGSTSIGAKWSRRIMSVPRNLSVSAAWLALNRIFVGTLALVLPANCAIGSSTVISLIPARMVPPGRSSVLRTAALNPLMLAIGVWATRTGAAEV